MPTREPRAERGRQRGVRMYTEIGRAFRLARRSRGLSQAFVSSAAGISQSMMSRIERGRGSPDLVTLSKVADVLGLDLVATVYPAGNPVRDAGHVRVFTRLQALLPSHFLWRTEIPMPRPGDQRALDAMIVEPAVDVGFELESRVLDAQALARRVTLKQRDSGLARMVLVLPDTKANREAVAAAAATLRPAFPLENRALLAALRGVTTPRANGILFV